LKVSEDLKRVVKVLEGLLKSSDAVKEHIRKDRESKKVGSVD